jgi:hypothetical protein
MYTLRQNIARWPKVFTAVVLLTVLDLVSSAASEPRSFLNGLVIVLSAVVAGIIYKLFAPTHAFKVAALLDRIEGRHESAIEHSCPECETEEDEYASDEETEEETEEESDVEPTV